MIASIHQPQYIPWSGFFHKVLLSDVYVLLDDVQFNDRHFIDRNKIISTNGWAWLKVPVIYSQGMSINEVKIKKDENWQEKHLKAIQRSYAKSPYFENFFPHIQKILGETWDSITDLDEEFIKLIFKELGINVKIIRSSSLGIKSVKTDRLIEICKAVGADTYISGSGGKNYMDEKLFEENGIKLMYQNFKHPLYEQKFTKDFIEGLSIIDMIFMKGQEASRILEKSGE